MELLKLYKDLYEEYKSNGMSDELSERLREARSQLSSAEKQISDPSSYLSCQLLDVKLSTAQISFMRKKWQNKE